LSLWYSRFEVTSPLRDHSKRKTRVQFVYVLPEVLHGDFLSEIEYLVNLEWNILQILTRNVLFFYSYSKWGELSFNIFKFFITKICKKAAQDFHRAVSKVFDRVKSVNIRKLAKDHKGYGSAAGYRPEQILFHPVTVINLHGFFQIGCARTCILIFELIHCALTCPCKVDIYFGNDDFFPFDKLFLPIF
jgi:hypothetical protein